MTRHHLDRLAGLGLALCVLLLPAPPAAAAITLSIRAVHGGIDLEFGRVVPGETSVTRELDVTCTNTGSARYRLYQELSGGLTNERGDRLPDGGFIMQLSQGMLGQVRGGTIVAVVDGIQELYQSNADGRSDTIRLAYAVAPGPDAAAGVYRGILRFTVESLDTGTIQTQTMRVQADIGGEVEVEFQPFSPRRVDFAVIEPGAETEAVELGFLVRSNVRGALSVRHELLEAPQNAQGAKLADEALLLSASSAAGARPWQPVLRGAEELLADREGRMAQFQLAYRARLSQNQPAGRYRGAARVQVQHDGTVIADEVIPIEFEVPEVLTMTVSAAAGGREALQFTNIEPGSGPAEQTMVVQVRSNLGRPYQVLAGLDHELVLASGEALPIDALIWSVAQPGKGASLITPGEPVRVGYEPLYRSDAQGSSDSFVLSYRLAIPSDARDGMYSGQVRFTITVF